MYKCFKTRGWVKNNLICYMEIVQIIILIALVFYPNNEPIRIEILISVITLIVTFSFGLLKQRIEDDRIFKELFISFNSRYDEKLNDVFNRMAINDDSKKTKELKKSEKLLIIDYFNLCSEEFLWYRKGRIPQEIWEAWEQGIIINLSLPLVKTLFEEETEHTAKKASYYGFVDYINPKIKEQVIGIL